MRNVLRLGNLWYMAIGGRRVHLMPPSVGLRRWLVRVERRRGVVVGVSIRMNRRVRRGIVHLVVILLLSPRLLVVGYGARHLLVPAGTMRHLVHGWEGSAQEPRRLLLSSAGEATPELLGRAELGKRLPA